jgi:hypothetical protein
MSRLMTTAYKCFTHDLRSPIQGGAPVWDGSLPYRLPVVEVDTSDTECAAGWNACRDAHTALQIAKLWPDGRPIRLFRITTRRKVIERGAKLRAATWTIEEEITDLRPAILALSQPFGEHAEAMADEQLDWHRALSRPATDPVEVAAQLQAALAHRGLAWNLRRFGDARDAWAARDARDAWAARAARDAWAAWAAWDAWAARAAWDAWDARDARAALTVYFAAKKGWISHPADLLTVGIRDAYAAGLSLAIPTGPTELGWSLERPAP